MNTGKKTSHIELLKNCALFGHLNETQLATLAARLKPVAFRRNQVIFLKNDPGDALYLIESGRVKISILNSEGKDLIINIYGAGEVFGEMSVFDGLRRSAAATAQTAVEAWVLSRGAFQQLLEEVPGLAASVISLLSRRLRFTTEQTEMLGLLGAYERVALKLLQLMPAEITTGPYTINLSQQELAAMLGLSREWLNKVLKSFADQGLVKLEWGKIIVSNPEEFKSWL
jgi:CRP/FNR family cyclic AMP-dependent transcriptional regulator